MKGGTSSTNIHCPNKACQKPLMSQVALAEGTRFVVRCYHCGGFVKIITGFNFIQKRLLVDLHDTKIVETEE